MEGVTCPFTADCGLSCHVNGLRGWDGYLTLERVKWGGVILKRYPEPMAHGPEACEPSHPCGSR